MATAERIIKDINHMTTTYVNMLEAGKLKSNEHLASALAQSIVYYMAAVEAGADLDIVISAFNEAMEISNETFH